MLKMKNKHYFENNKQFILKNTALQNVTDVYKKITRYKINFHSQITLSMYVVNFFL